MPERENGPGITRAASEVTPPRGTAPSVAQLVEHLEQVQRRVLQDALAEATSAYWCRRADQFEWARPTLDDFAGNATDTQRRAKWHELAAVARACRARASIALIQGNDIDVELLDVLAEVA